MFESLFSRSGLSLDRLRGFLEMAEAGSIAGAAPGDSVRQSLISRQIRELEGYFGAELTVRKGKTLSPTPAGRRLAALVREQFLALEDFRAAQAGETRGFTLGAGTSLLEWLVTPRLPGLAHLLGKARIGLEMRRTRALAEAVREGMLDFALLRRDAVAGASRKNCAPVLRLTFHLCVPRSLLGRGATLETLHDAPAWRQVPFATGRGGGQMERAITEAMVRLHGSFRAQYECASMIQVRSLVQGGVCAAILPSVALPGLDPGRILSVPFAPLADVSRTLVLHWNPRRMGLRNVADEALRRMARLLGENPAA